MTVVWVILAVCLFLATIFYLGLVFITLMDIDVAKLCVYLIEHLKRRKDKK